MDARAGVSWLFLILIGSVENHEQPIVDSKNGLCPSLLLTSSNPHDVSIKPGRPRSRSGLAQADVVEN